jgi:hypothetical protein
MRGDVTLVALTANPGDEMQWGNQPQAAARVVVVDPVAEIPRCPRKCRSGMGNSQGLVHG